MGVSQNEFSTSHFERHAFGERQLQCSVHKGIAAICCFPRLSNPDEFDEANPNPVSKTHSLRVSALKILLEPEHAPRTGVPTTS